MFYHFILPLQEYISFLRLFQYITFRSAYAALTALILVLILGQFIIRWLKRLRFKEEIRNLGPESHQAKAGTPTMGGLLIIGAVFISSILWGNFNSIYFIVVLVVSLLLAGLGFFDDYIKSVKKHKDGLSARLKFGCQCLIAFAAALVVYYYPSNADHGTTLFVPFMNEALLDLGWFWVLFSVIVIVGSSNAVNLTDGLDGLAIGSILIVTVTFAIMAYLSGHAKISQYLRIPYVPDGAELTVFLAAIVGASIGFLWFNSNPATVFMGDTGSLSLGGIIGVVAVMLKKEIFLVIVGGVFVLEALSVIIQVLSYKTRKRRVFKMAPLHHHFELSGWPEQKVVVRMWILGLLLAIIGLSSLKIL